MGSARRASTSIRLDADFIDEVKVESELYLRSVPDQVQYWAKLGQAIRQFVTAEDALSLISGHSILEIKPKTADYIDPMSVLDNESANAQVKSKVMKVGYGYQASTKHPGKLERVAEDGSTQYGTFENGEFVVEGDL